MTPQNQSGEKGNEPDRMAVGCRTCDKPLSARNRSGYCPRHVAAACAADPVWRAKQRAGVIRALQEHPERITELRQRVRVIADNIDIEDKRRRAKAIGLGAMGQAYIAAHPEVRIRAGNRVSETRMAWCPRELREAYRRLVYSKKLPAREARRMILAQHDRDMAAFRQKLEAAA